MDEKFSVFSCPQCNTEIQASPDMVGLETECPACGRKITIPEATASGAGVVRHGEGDIDPESISAMKSRTIRIELEDI